MWVSGMRKRATVCESIPGKERAEIEALLISHKELPQKYKQMLEKYNMFTSKAFNPEPIIKQLNANNPLTIDVENIKGMNLKDEYERLMEDQTHGLNCMCLSCVFWTYKFFHPKSRPIKDRFFFGFVLMGTASFHSGEKKITRYDWKRALRIMFDITADTKYLDFEDAQGNSKKNIVNRFYKLGIKYVMMVGIAFWERKKRINELNDYFFGRPRAYGTKKFFAEEKEFVENTYRLANMRGQIRLRDILHDSHRTIADFYRTFKLYDGNIGLMLGRSSRKDQIVFVPIPNATISHPLERMFAEIKDGMIPVKPSTIK